DALEVGAEVHRALIDEDLHLFRFDAAYAIEIAVEHLRLAATHHDQHAVDAQAGHGPDVSEHAVHHRAFIAAHAIGQVHDLEACMERFVAGDTGDAAQGHLDERADAGAMGRSRSR